MFPNNYSMAKREARSAVIMPSLSQSVLPPSLSPRLPPRRLLPRKLPPRKLPPRKSLLRPLLPKRLLSRRPLLRGRLPLRPKPPKPRKLTSVLLRRRVVPEKPRNEMIRNGIPSHSSTYHVISSLIAIKSMSSFWLFVGIVFTWHHFESQQDVA